MDANHRAEADAYHVTYHDVAMGVMHAENRPHPTQPAARSYGSQIPGIRACARNDAPVGKRARRGLSAAYERVFAAMEAIAEGTEPSCCVVTLAMLSRSPLRCHAAMVLRRSDVVALPVMSEYLRYHATAVTLRGLP